MIKLKLNHTEKSILDDGNYGMVHDDWLTMHQELARLNKAIRDAVGDMELIKTADEPTRIGWRFYCHGIKDALDILRKHFPDELKEDDEDLLEEEDLQIEERERRKQEGG